MMVGRVTGTVVSTNKIQKLTGARMLIVEPVNLETIEPRHLEAAGDGLHDLRHRRFPDASGKKNL